MVKILMSNSLLYWLIVFPIWSLFRWEKYKIRYYLLFFDIPGNVFILIPSKLKKNTSKKWTIFFIFRIFHCRVQSLKMFFCHQKVTKLCSENFEKQKKFSPFFFCVFGRGIKKNNFRLVLLFIFGFVSRLLLPTFVIISEEFFC